MTPEDRQRFYGDLTDDELMNGMALQGLAALLPLDFKGRQAQLTYTRRTAKFASVMANANFHLGLVDLVNNDPAIEAVLIDNVRNLSNLKKSISVEWSDASDDLPLKQRRAAEKRVDVLRQELPFNSVDSASIHNLFTGLPRGQDDSFRLTSGNAPHYLSLVLGDALFALWHMNVEQKALHGTIDAVGLAPKSPRPRL